MQSTIKVLQNYYPILFLPQKRFYQILSIIKVIQSKRYYLHYANVYSVLHFQTICRRSNLFPTLERSTRASFSRPSYCANKANTLNYKIYETVIFDFGFNWFGQRINFDLQIVWEDAGTLSVNRLQQIDPMVWDSYTWIQT